VRWSPAGLIGSHPADLLLREGWRVRILDNLEPQTHRRGKPGWMPPGTEFLPGQIQDRATLAAALAGIDVVFRQGAYGGDIREIAK
jgi:dTDP-L-rhamnose 4-epimerase